MRRLGSALRFDMILQVRNGFYLAAGLVAFCYILILSQLPLAELGWLMPVFVLSNLSIGTFYFIAGLVFLEKSEGSLSALVVTPLRVWEYLASKTVTLALLALAENGIILLLAWGADFGYAAFVLGLLMASAQLVLIGFILVSRYDSINEYLFPSALYSLGFLPPFLDYFGLWRSGWVYLHPLQAPLLLLKAAFLPINSWQWFYAASYGTVWVAILMWLSARSFRRFVVSAAGSRA